MSGLEARYNVTKIDDPKGKHNDCGYFVLDPQHDPLALRALSYYAALADDAGHTDLSRDLRRWTHAVRNGRALPDSANTPGTSRRRLEDQLTAAIVGQFEGAYGYTIWKADALARAAAVVAVSVFMGPQR